MDHDGLVQPPIDRPQLPGRLLTPAEWWAHVKPWTGLWDKVIRPRTFYECEYAFDLLWPEEARYLHKLGELALAAVRMRRNSPLSTTLDLTFSRSLLSQ